MPRNDYNKKINSYINPLGVIYDGENSKKISEEFFALLDGNDEYGKPRKELAIKRAKGIYENSNLHNPAQAESSTTVFKLVEELLKYI